MKENKQIKKKKRILFYGAGFIDYSIQLVNELVKYYDVLMVLHDNILEESQIKRIDKKVNVIYLRRSKSFSFASFKFITEFYKLFKTFKPQIIHFQGTFIWLSILCKFMRNCRIVTTLHDVKFHPGEEGLVNEWAYRILVNNSDQIILHSNYLQNEFIKKYGNRIKTYVIPHGNFDIYPISKMKEKINMILFFGRIRKYKGIEYLIKSEPLIRKEIMNFKIIIAGKGESIQNYCKFIKNMESFEFRNYSINEKEMADLFSSCSVVVLPYIEASQSGVIPVAYRYKKPVIATKVGGIPEMVKDGETGILIKPKNEKLLANAIIDLLKDEKYRYELGKNGYIYSKKYLNWRRISLMTGNVYRDEII